MLSRGRVVGPCFILTLGHFPSLNLIEIKALSYSDEQPLN
jgi:hypothetical protein